jgi:hypothetical protein
VTTKGRLSPRGATSNGAWQTSKCCRRRNGPKANCVKGDMAEKGKITSVIRESWSCEASYHAAGLG